MSNRDQFAASEAGRVWVAQTGGRAGRSQGSAGMGCAAAAMTEVSQRGWGFISCLMRSAMWGGFVPVSSMG